MDDKPPRFDGFGLAMMGLAALLAIGMVAAGIIRTPEATDDTSVQSSMAWAAWAMVWVSVIGGTIGAFSLYLIYRTLLAAQRSAIAAEATVAETRAIGRAQTRAYLSVGSIELDATKPLPEIRLELRNVGQSPAVHVGVGVTVQVENSAEDDEEMRTVDQFVVASSQRDLLSGEVILASIHMPRFRKREYTRLVSEPSLLIFTFTVDLDYEDVFEETQDVHMVAFHIASEHDIFDTVVQLKRVI